jgi:hypothetical protein
MTDRVRRPKLTDRRYREIYRGSFAYEWRRLGKQLRITGRELLKAAGGWVGFWKWYLIVQVAVIVVAVALEICR